MTSLAILLLFVTSLLANNGRSHPYEESPFGFHPASISRAGYPYERYDDAEYIGVRWTREPVYAFWFIVQPDTADPTYDFTLYDDQWGDIPDSINILANIAPQGRLDEGYCLPGSYLPINTAKYLRFVRATVERYDGDGIDDMPGLTNPITYWQVGNEPNDAMVSGFAELQRITYVGIKQACPDAAVLIGGVAGFPHGYVAAFDDFYASILQQLGGGYVDIFDFHWYGTASGEYRFIDTATGQDALNHIRGTLAGCGFPDTLPIWVTENGSYSGDPAFGGGGDPPFQSEAQQAGDYFKRFVYSLSRGVEKVFPAFGLMESFMHDGGYFDFTGLIYDGWGPHDGGLGVKKLGYYTYRKMTEKLEGADWSTLEEVALSSPSEVHAFRVLQAGRPCLIAWWDYFTEPDYATGDTAYVTLVGIEDDALSMTAAVPPYALGSEIQDYDSAFTVTSLSVTDGVVIVPLAESPVILEPADAVGTADGAPLPSFRLSVCPSPTRGPCRIITEVPASVSVLDLSGRSICTLQVGASGDLIWDTRDALRPGAYMLHAESGTRAAKVRLVVLP